jgi:glutathione S-transferase
MPLGQIPVLEVDGVKLPQSISIARYLANQFQLAGRDNLEQAKVDAVVDTVTDFVSKYFPIYMKSDETTRKEVLNEEGPKHFKNLDILQGLYQGNNFFVGNHLTYADLWFYDIIETVLNVDSTILDKYPNLQKIHKSVENDAKVAAYLKDRPKLPF